MKQRQAQAGAATRAVALLATLTLATLLAGCGREDDGHADHDEGKAKAVAGGHAEEGQDKEGRAEGGHEEGEGALKLSAEEAARAGIQVEEMRVQPLADTLIVTATIQPDQERLAHVGARVEGRITAVPARLGDLVKQGQTLARLDSVAVGEAHAALNQAQAELGIAEADLKRAQALVADEIIARKDFLRAQAERDKAAAARRAAADRLRLLGGSPAASDEAVSAFAVTAPFAGTIIERKATVGELATPSDALFSVADLARVWILADLPEAALAKVREGAQATVSVPAYPGESFKGRVAHIGAGVDKDSRTVAARIEVANADRRLKPGMFATARIEVAGDKREAIALPDAAIVLLEGQPTVFVFEHEAYEARQVEPGERLDGRTVLKSGVTAGEQVVTAGAYALKARKLKSQLGHGH
jgi:cobalt-zinc-cadmium efflux system membrane fusion protein